LRINKIVATTSLAVMTSGLMVAGTAVTASASAPHVKVNPHVHVIITPATITPNKVSGGDVVTVTASGFPASDADGTHHMYVFECAFKALSTQDQGYCDTQPSAVNNSAYFSTTLSNGSATGTTTFTILEGSAFVADSYTGPDAECGFSRDPSAASNSCLIGISDTATNTADTYVQAGSITFKDSRDKSVTKIALPKSLPKAGHTLKFKVGVLGLASATAKGKVKITDNGKKLETDKVPSSGLIKVKEKHIKKGKHTLKATYSGDKHYQGSKDKAKIKIKK
jgi:hypothetical protein